VKFVPIIQSVEQLDWIATVAVDEVIFYHRQFSREGGLDFEAIKRLAQVAELKAYRPLIQVDRLIEQSGFENVLETCLSWPKAWGIRVQDLGLAQALYEKNRSFQLILEAGHANFLAVEAWSQLLAGPLERVVLNNEIPKRNLHPMLAKLECPSESLGFGSLVMYYTPRALLSWSGQVKHALISSDEMGSGKYCLLESEAGTVMYFNKDLSLLRYIGELDQAGLGCLRLDLREVGPEHWLFLLDALQSNSDAPLKSNWPRPLLHGFYGENKSDSVFDRLGTKQVEWSREPWGEVLDQTSSRLLVRAWREQLELPLSLAAKDGKGRWHEWSVERVYGLDGAEYEKRIPTEIFLMQRPKLFASGTLLYRGLEKKG